MPEDQTRTSSSPVETAERQPIRVLLVESQLLVRRAMRRALEWEADVVVVAEAGTAEEALRLAHSTEPEVAVVGRMLEDADGIEVARVLRESLPGLQVIVSIAEDDLDGLLHSVEVGVRAFLTASTTPEQFSAAIRAVRSGDLMISEELMRALLERLAERHTEREEALRALSDLTPRQRLVLALLVRGASSRTIAELLGISLQTVRTHAQHVLDKLGVHSRLEAVALANRNRVVRNLLDQEAAEAGFPREGPDSTGLGGGHV